MSDGRTREFMRTARRLYAGGPLLLRLLQEYRPLICPFEPLVDAVPADARVLDVGCGAGLFLALLAAEERIQGSVGFDASTPAIAAARHAEPRLPPGTAEYRHLRVEDAWPEGLFDVVSMIDVMHHIDPGAQHDVFVEAVAHVRPGGVMLYKDMGTRPRWMALANRLHDLVLARQWIHYRPIADVREWAAALGLTVLTDRAYSAAWYRHELLVLRRPGQPA